MTLFRVADSARLMGGLSIGKGAYIAQGTVLRSEGTSGSISLGNQSMVLENSVVIGTPSYLVDIGSKTVFGHKCIVVGAQIGDLCEVGNGTIFLPGSQVGDYCIFGEGTVIAPGKVVPSGSVVVGRPGRVIRKLTDEDRAMISRMRGHDVTLSPFEPQQLHVEPKSAPGKGEDMGKLYPFGSKTPTVDETACVYDTAEITGDVVVGAGSKIASGVRIIGNTHGPVRIGNNVQILENTVLHLLPDNALIIEDNVTIGPGCIVHGCTIGAGSVVEAGAIVCDYSVLGRNTLVKCGSLVKQRSVVEEHQIVEGFPAKVVGNSSDALERPDWAIWD
ncbi:carbonic anhydrase/acetyltransferase [Acidaminobacter hydrogenoformans]|uniref:Carbonic anhydrase or acetyltransferase, isoleucine patch superfamily n=1 Tax=Acidaminobacter hydrogenoformans DSM 2784 TaxID=1120920 RepID=A0A1G5RX73_9FIRM|nr:carbonic anhydrase/acetyltransferase [Acidaminobacter hydrogenoformans]SCZ78735.1 Carbonic anhydrase or acetyltransferase, isoleucine patch superfamily [Acidaminobacter hydrogenoformans DSM 2784]